MSFVKNDFHPPESYEKNRLIERHFLRENLYRSKIFARVAILLEALMIFINIFSILDDENNTLLIYYLILYCCLLMASIFMLFYIYKYEKLSSPTEKQDKRFNIVLFNYVHFFLIWSAVISLLDQKGYGHVMVFVIGFMVSILYHFPTKTLFFLYLTPVLVLFVGLPFFQSSQEVLMGHYINLTVFLIFSWIMSRVFYNNNSAAYLNKLLIVEANIKLGLKIEENEKINVQLEGLNQKLNTMANMDELSKIPNRRGLQQFLSGTLFQSNEPRNLSIMMIDIDDFKLFNDHYGHLEGDEVIKIVAQTLKECTANVPSSMTARFGGEEFIIAIFDIDEYAFNNLAEDVRRAIVAKRIPHEFSRVTNVVTVSVGIASGTVNNNTDYKYLVEVADKALYDAKSRGKNCVVRNEHIYEKAN